MQSLPNPALSKHAENGRPGLPGAVQQALPLGLLPLLPAPSEAQAGVPGTPTGTWSDAAALAALLEAAPCGILLAGPEGELRAINDPFAKMMGQEPDELRGLGSFDALVARLSAGFAEPGAMTARWRGHRQMGAACRDELELVALQRKRLQRFSRPLKDALGRSTGWMEMYSDVTAERMAEDNRFHTERMVALGRLVSSVAHEISNPLTSILGTAQLLLRRRPSSQRDAGVQRILEEAERAGLIARNLLQFARGAKAERAAVEINEVVLRALALRAHDLHLGQIETQLDLDGCLPPVLGDAAQLQQVLLNLLLNAEQAIQHGRGRGQIRLRTRRSASGRVAVDVMDDGPGIAPESLPRIFDPFFTTKPPGAGTGLGLSIAYGIAQDHGGTVIADSRPGFGAAFTLELPAAAQAPLLAAKPAAAQGAGLPSRRLPGAGRRLGRNRGEAVLVIEDEPAVAALIADVLAGEGHRAEVVPDGRQGLARIKQQTYGLVICDLRMPHLSGPVLFKELLRQGHPLRQRFVFVTGDVLSPHTAEFLRSSGAPYLAKPFLLEELKDVIRRALRPAREPEASAMLPAAAGLGRVSQKGRQGR